MTQFLGITQFVGFEVEDADKWHECIGLIILATPAKLSLQSVETTLAAMYLGDDGTLRARPNPKLRKAVLQ